MKKNIFLSILFFSLGFLAHAFIFPDFLANGVSDVTEIALPAAQPTGQQTGPRELQTKIMFDGQHFSKRKVTIEVGTYLMVINSSPDKKMNLTSNNPAFVTPREYGESEAVQALIETKGDIVIADKNNPGEKVVVTVK